MATKMVRQTQFNTGEVDQQVWKRTDVNEYLTAARSLLNCEVGTTGLVKKRKGTLALNNVSEFAVPTSRMFEFIDNNGIYYVVLAVDEAFIIFTAPYSEKFVVTSDGYYVVTSRGSFVVAEDATLTYVTTIVTPYEGYDISALDYAQDNDSIIFSHPNYRPARLFVSEYSSIGDPTFVFEYLDIYPRPAYDFNNINYNDFDVDLTGSTTTTLTLRFYNMGLSAATAFDNAWVGGQIVGGGNTDNEPVGYAIITAVGAYGAGNGGEQTFTATVQIQFNITSPNYATKGSQYSIKQPCWSDTSTDTYDLGYPAKVLFYQNRLWLANTKALNNTVFGSKVNAPISFDVGTGKDTDAIVYTIGQTQSGSIQWLNGGKQLEIYCQNSEFSCPQDQNSGITPSTFSVRQQSAYGASPTLKPQTYINDSYFSTKTGKALVNYNFTGVGLSYKSTNISVASSHLVKNPSSRALLRGSDSSQDNFIYFLNQSDNTITAFQFASEYKLAALTPIEFQTDVQLIDICTVNNLIYVLKYYTLTQQYMIEVMDETIWIDSQENAYMAADGTVTGLDRFNGYSVQVVYSNQDYGQYTVADGSITVDNRTDAPQTVQVGLLYDVEIKPMYPFAGTAAAPFMKNLTRIYVDYYQSLNFFINGKLVPYQSFADIQAGLPLTPRTDTAIFSPVSGWQRFDNDAIVITQSAPFDLQILGIGYQIEVAVI